MRDSQTAAGFGLYDLLTIVVPGAFFLIFAFANSGDILSVSVPVNSNNFLIVFTTISIVVGIIINLGRDRLRLIPRDIRYICYELTNDSGFLSIGDTVRRDLPLVQNEGIRIITNNKNQFYSVLNSYGLDDDPNSLRESYLMLLSDTEPDLSSRAYRDKMTMEFCANMVFSSTGAIGFAIIGAINGTAPGYSTVLSLIFVVPILFLFIPLVFSLERRWASALIRESILATDIPVEYSTDSEVRPPEEKVETEESSSK